MLKYIIVSIILSVCLVFSEDTSKYKSNIIDRNKIDVDKSIFSVFAEETSEYKSGYIDGKKNAVGESIWFYVGFFTGPFGLGASFILEPTSSPNNINYNKSDYYLKGYLKGYKDETAFNNIQFASTGFLALISVFLII